MFISNAFAQTAPAASGGAEGLMSFLPLVAMFVVMILLGAIVYTFTVPPQTRIVHNSEGAPTLAATFIATAFNLGYALGAVVGALLLTVGLGYPSLPVVGIVAGLAAGAISLWSWRLDRS